MKQIILTYDWLGPEGIWPNAQSLDYFISPEKYGLSNYAIANSKHQYHLEERRHQFTYSKIKALLGAYNVTYKHIAELEDNRAVYDITPLLKPYQWADSAFDYVSETAKSLQRKGQVLFFINDMGEGYSNQDYDFYSALHAQIKKYNLKENGIVYVSANALQVTEYKKYCKLNKITNPIKVREVFLFEFCSKEEVTVEKQYHYICLNRSPAPHRQALVYELWRRDLLKYGLVSMPDPNVKSDYKFSKSYLDEYNIDSSYWDEFLPSLPYIIDTQNFEIQNCSSDSLSIYYQKSLISIITENTYTTEISDCIKFTEKTFRAIANHCIPAYIYAPNAAVTLSNVGYNVCNVSSNITEFVDWLELFVQKPINYYQNYVEQANANFELIKARQYVTTNQTMEQLIDEYCE